MTPTIGRIVHYTNLGDRDGRFPPQVQAAIVTKINDDDTIALHIFYPTGAFDMAAVPQAAPAVAAGTEEARGKWQWPDAGRIPFGAAALPLAAVGAGLGRSADGSHDLVPPAEEPKPPELAALEVATADAFGRKL